MADYGIKISKDGISVLTATEIQLAFTSKRQMLKEFMSGTGTLTLTGGTTDATATITHNLGYRAAFFVFANFPTGTVIAGLEGIYRVPMRNGRNFFHVYGVSNTNTLDIKVRNSPADASSYSFTYKYFIMVDKAEA